MNQVFSFIACTNDPVMMRECRLYISRLYVPDGWRVEIIEITDAKSMTEGYNRAICMKVTDPPRITDVPIRIYLHQDVFIINRWFLHNLLFAYQQFPDVGMLGMVGTPSLDPSGIMWAGSFIGDFYVPNDTAYQEERLSSADAWKRVDAIDGFLMSTRVDLPWREDLFDGFDFYDVSQSLEFTARGYAVIVPMQSSPWCVHDGGMVLSLHHYERHRRTLLEHYHWTDAQT